MDSLPRELTDPINFLKKFSYSQLSDDILAGWEQIADKFELMSLSPIYSHVAKMLSEDIAELIIELIDKPKSDFKFPNKITDHIIEEQGIIEYINIETGVIDNVPNFLFSESKRDINDDDKKRIWTNFSEMLNRFKGICSKFGYNFDLSLPEEFINELILMEIDDKPVIEFGSRENLYKALSGNIPESQFSSLKIEVTINIGEAAYIIDRIKKSVKAPIVEKLMDHGAFYKKRKLSFDDTRKQKSCFINNVKKYKTTNA